MAVNGEVQGKSGLIIGASRGLGRGLSLELLQRGWTITATVRSVRGAGCEAYEAHHGQLTMDTLDINLPSMIDAFMCRIEGKLFDVVFIVAGVGDPEGKTVETVSSEDVVHLIMTNAISPIRLAHRLLPYIRPETGILAFMSSFLGSVEANTTGVSSLYSASKAALNSLTRSFVATMPRQDITVLNIHPGWVRTSIGGATADIDVETSVAGIADILEAKAGMGGQHFLDYKGNAIPW
ncbi:MAG TPA: SDR family oxidoreductase [Acidocella sp.]|jgi:NAD(P)-dependent dehydrogenase (short-subunit alcohol dehydrogenase family)|uniref:SDR family oxidoreductase n=1 Tax=Acidocella sp. TaxID=50710 RepID=UPI002C896759|nr:SDR family oxidoreductase [Acidocella sp.]HVE22147.1 SDR family oxidoreductase [Acidocella sp.]